MIAAFWQNFTGSVFSGVMVFSFVVVTLLVIAGELAIGEGFVMTILMSVIPQAVLSWAQNLIPLSAGLAGFGYLMESTVHNGIIAIVGQNCSWGSFQTFGELFSVTNDLFTGILGLGVLAGAYITQSGSVAEEAKNSL